MFKDRSHPRPRIGKTAKDKAAGTQRFHQNRRIWTGKGPDDPAGRWVKA